jgi:hypothetical protein
MGPRACGQQRSITVPRGQSEPQLNGLIGRMNSTDRIWPESGRGYDRSCRARPADRSLVAEDRSAGGVRDQTGPGTLSPRWVRSRGVNRGQQRAGVVTERSSESQVAGPMASRPRAGETGDVEFESLHPAAESPEGSAHGAVVTEDGPHPLGERGAVAARRQRRRWSPAAPPACHTERSRAVSSGQPRSLRRGNQAGCAPLTWGGQEIETAWDAGGHARCVRVIGVVRPISSALSNVLLSDP